MSDDPEPLLAAGEAAGACSLGAPAAVRLGRLTLGVRLLIALLTVPEHPVTSKPAARAAALRTTHLVLRWRTTAGRASLFRK